MDFYSCVARRTRAKTDQHFNELWQKQGGKTSKLNRRSKQKENLGGLGDASNHIEIKDEEVIGNTVSESGGSRKVSKQERRRHEGHSDTSNQIEIEDEEIIGNGEIEACGSKSEQHEGINDDNNDNLTNEYGTNMPDRDSQIGSKKSNLSSNEGEGSPSFKNVGGEVSTQFRLVDYSSDSSSSNEENDNEGSLSSSDTIDEDSDDEMDSADTVSSEEGSDDEEFDAVKCSKKVGRPKNTTKSRTEFSEGDSSKVLYEFLFHSLILSQSKSPLTEKTPPLIEIDLSDLSDGDSSSSSKDSRTNESEENGGAYLGRKNADSDAKKKKSNSKDKYDHFKEIAMDCNKVMKSSSINARSKRKFKKPSAKENIDDPLSEDPVLSSGPRKSQSQLKSSRRKNLQLVDEEEEEETHDVPLGEDPVKSSGSRKSQSQHKSKNPRVVDEEEEETRGPTKKRKISASNNYDIFKVIVDSILNKGVIDEQKQAYTSLLVDDYALPSKFRFEDEVKPPEKTESEKTEQDLFTEMTFGETCDEIGSFANVASEENENPNVRKTELTQMEFCLNEKHQLVLDEEIGLICIYCHVVVREIRHVMAPFRVSKSGVYGRERYVYDNKGSMFDGLQFEDPMEDSSRGFSKESNGNGTVWDTVPGIHDFYPHQAEGLEFIWKNLEGTIRLDELKDNNSTGVGGCIISHAPGTGKSRLTIVFIEMYLKIFPKSRPVIIAPASMLLTWEEEFKKWKVNFPFHNLSNSELSGKESELAFNLLHNSNYSVKERMRIVKLYSWCKDPSILGVSYQLYEKLAGGESYVSKKGKSKRVKGIENKKISGCDKILLELPGLVVLDEGHTPRNQRSRIWNALLKLQTEKRIILSGTPFQNNFGELFNTLHIVRPAIVDSLAKDKTFVEAKRKYGRMKSAQGRKTVPFNGSSEIWDASINKLKEVIAPFVHVHKGSILQESLPGLVDSVILLNPGLFQKQIIDRIERTQDPLEFNHKVSLVSIHPSLISHCKLSAKEKSIISRDELKKHALKPNIGVKTRFIMELINLCVALNEKVLIFSQYVRPLGFIMDQLKEVFGWDEGKEVLLMKGKQGPKFRQKIIEDFNNLNNDAKVLLASTKCCSEGINLVGASRVVLLDVVWNPSVERQAISRAYRIGQKKVVYSYHLIAAGTTEGEKLCRQAGKGWLSERVFSTNCKEKGDNDDHNKRRNGKVLNDKVLQELCGHNKLKDMFEKIIYQPQEAELIENFGLGMK